MEQPIQRIAHEPTTPSEFFDSCLWNLLQAGKAPTVAFEDAVWLVQQRARFHALTHQLSNLETVVSEWQQRKGK